MDRPPVRVVGGVDDELVIEGESRPGVEAIGVISLQYFLRPVIERAVADQYSEPAGGEIGLRLGREAIDDASHADPVVGASPGRSLQHGAGGNAFVAIGPADDFVQTRAPTGAREHAEIGGDRLLEIGVEAVIGSHLAHQRDVGIGRAS